MTQYRRKSEIVEAFKWMPDHETMDGKKPLPEWADKDCVVTGQKLEVWTSIGMITAMPGDWVLRGDRDLVVVPAETFEYEYEAVRG